MTAGPPGMAAAGGPRAGTSWPVILAGRRGRLLIGMTLTELVVAVQILIVVTVLPAVVRQLGGIQLYGLALSVAAIAGIGAAPLAVRLLDRWGARVVVPAGALVFTCGALGAGLADRMTVLVAARFFEGAGAAALGAIAVSGIAALYEEPQRPKVMVLGNLAWVIPSVAGPALGSLAVATVGWRWAFTAQLLLLAGLLAVLGGSAEGGPAGAVVAVGGVVVAVAAVRRIMPRGMLTMRPGLPVATMALFCCGFAFFAVDGFVPLLLTVVDGRSVAVAGIVVTLAVVGWTLGGIVQARLARRGWTPPRLLAVGGALIVAGTAGTAIGLLPGAWLAPYLAWAVGGFGMGLAYTGAWLAAMAAGQTGGGGATKLAGPLVADRMGAALGAGVGGVGIAAATRAGLGVGTGIGIGLAVAVAGACAIAVAAHRMA